MSDQKQHFNDILQSFNSAMLVTVGEDETPRARPMRIAESEDTNVLWFVTNRQSGKVDAIKSNQNVGITMQGGGQFLSMTGVAEVVEEQSQLDEVWSDTWKIWFPEGKDDPSIILLRINPVEGEYWDMSGTNRIRFIYQAGKAYFTGTEIDTSSMDSNAKVSL